MGGREHAALHVVDARTVDAVALASEGQRAVERAGHMDSVEMAQDQHARPLAAAGHGGDDDVAVAIDAGLAIDRRTQAGHRGLGLVHHGVDARDMDRGAFGQHPVTQPLEHFLGIEGGLVAGSHGAETPLR